MEIFDGFAPLHHTSTKSGVMLHGNESQGYVLLPHGNNRHPLANCLEGKNCVKPIFWPQNGNCIFNMANSCCFLQNISIHRPKNLRWVSFGRYRVINLDCEKVLSFYSQMLLLNDLELIFLCSTMFDIFCVKISLICVKYFLRNISLK